MGADKASRLNTDAGSAARSSTTMPCTSGVSKISAVGSCCLSGITGVRGVSEMRFPQRPRMQSRPFDSTFSPAAIRILCEVQ
jgi:hypothetical protein